MKKSMQVKKKRIRSKIISIFITAFLLIQMMPLQAFALDGTTWDGSSYSFSTADNAGESAENPIIIDTAGKLASLAEQVNGGEGYTGTYFKLTENLNLNNIDWTPIGTETHPFGGVFDGDNNQITGIRIGTSGEPDTGLDYVGLFGHVGVAGEGTCIKNLSVEVGIYSDIMYAFAGGLAGKVDYAEINNCYSSGDVSADGMMSFAGGLIGSINGENCMILNCGSEADILTTGWGSIAGGLISDDDAELVANSYAAGSVSSAADDANACAGGFVGRNFGEITNCYAAGEVTGGGGDSYTGGFVGNNDSNATYGVFGTITSGYWNNTPNAAGVGLNTGTLASFTSMFEEQMILAAGESGSLVDSLNIGKADIGDASWFDWDQDAGVNGGFPILVSPDSGGSGGEGGSAVQWAEGYPKVGEGVNQGVEVFEVLLSTTTDNCMVYTVSLSARHADITAETIVGICEATINPQDLYPGQYLSGMGNLAGVYPNESKDNMTARAFDGTYYTYAVLQNIDSGEFSSVEEVSLTGEGSGDTAAPALTVTVEPGTAAGTTKATITEPASLKFIADITDNAVTTPNAGDLAPSGGNVVDPYLSGADISAGIYSAGKYLQVYDVDAEGKVEGFFQRQLTADDIKDGKATDYVITGTTGTSFQVYGGESYSTLAEALANCNIPGDDEELVIRLGNADAPLALSEVLCNTPANNQLIAATYTGNIRIQNNNTAGTAGLVIPDGVIATLQDLTITQTGTVASGFYGVYLAGSGSLNIREGTNITLTSQSARCVHIPSGGTGTVNMTAGSLTAGSGAYCAIENSGNGTVNISGGTARSDSTSGPVVYNCNILNVSGTAQITGYLSGVYNSANVNISGGTIEATSESGKAIHTEGSGTITMTSGTVRATNNTNNNGDNYGIYNNGGTVNISGGTVSTAGIRQYNSTAAIFHAGTATVTISGTASITGTRYGIYNSGTKISDNGAVYISGGTVTTTGLGDYYGTSIGNANTGLVTIAGGTVSNPAPGGDTAVVSNSGSGTVNLSGGIISKTGAAGTVVKNSGSGTINVSSGTVSASGTEAPAIVINNTNSGTINISGGTVQTTNPSAYCAVSNNNGGTVNLSGGTVSCSGTGAAAAAVNLYNDSGSMVSTVSISGTARIISASNNTVKLNKSTVADKIKAIVFGKAIYSDMLADVVITGADVSGSKEINADNYGSAAVTASNITTGSSFISWTSDSARTQAISTANGASIGSLTTGANAGVADIYLKAGVVAPAPSVLPTGGSFTDTDDDTGEIGGTISWTAADPTTGITGYKIYWGSDTTTKLAGHGTAAYTVNGADSTSQAVAADTALPDEAATHFLIYSYNAGGESANCLAVAINDAASEFAGGNGEASTPYQITDWEQLNNVRNYLGSGNVEKHFVLMNDLDSGIAGYAEYAGPTANGGKGWIPIGTGGSGGVATHFTGSFDGNGKIIKDLFINDPGMRYAGLFGTVNWDAEIKGVRLEDVDITGDSYVGGLAGYNWGAITGSSVTGTVSGVGSVGGLAGHCEFGSLVNSYAICTVTGSSGATGGLTGYLSANNGVIENSFALGSVTTPGYAGGLAGLSGGVITNSYAACRVTGGNDATAGGLVGEYSDEYGNISGSYYDTQISGQTDTGKGIPKTTAEMKDVNTFEEDWDFADTWTIVETAEKVSYPYLQWMEEMEGWDETQAPGYAQQVPTVLPTNGSFTDTDDDTDEIGGTISWTAADPTTGITGYKIYWGSDTTTKLAGHDTAAYTVNGAAVTFYSVAADTALPEEATHFLIHSYNAGGESTSCLAIEIVDAIEAPGILPVEPQGEGTVSSPYLIAEPGNLLWMSAQSSDLSGFRDTYFKQTADIDMSTVENFTPIAIMGGPFQGEYDGCSHKISNLTIETEEQTDVGLFAAIGVLAEIKRLTLEDVSISAEYLSGPNSNTNIGGIAGASTGKILDCHIRNSAEGQSQIIFTGKNNYTGGVIGSNGGTVSRCSNAANIIAGGTGGYTHFIGGIAGLNSSGEIGECFNSGAISGSESNTDNVYLAGIAGRNYFWSPEDGTIGYCYSTGTLTINDSAASSQTAGITSYTTSPENISDSFYLDSTADNGFQSWSPEEVNTDGARTEADLETPGTFAGWDDDIWDLTAGSFPELKPILYVTYNGNGSAGGTVPADDSNYSQGAVVTVMDNTGDLTVTGYTFGGWNTAADGNGTSYAAGATFTMGASDMILYAKWTQDGGNNSGNGNGDGRHTSPPANNAPITIDGQTLQQGATVGTATQNGRTTTTVTLDTQRMTEIINSGQTGSVVDIPITGETDTAVGEMDGDLVKAMENKQAVLEIRTDTATYTLPAQQINIDAVSAELGQNVELSDIKVSVRITNPPEETVEVIEDQASEGGYSIVVPPIEFSITASYGNQSVEISRFNAYVDRTVAIPDGVDPEKITTAVIADPDGTVRHVPTKIIVIDGRYYAQINSLTNSVYSVIWNPVEFADAAKHWAKDAINDMGSRMVITGDENGNFAPNRDITRAEFAAIVVRALGLEPDSNENNPFSDVKNTDWYDDYVKTAYEYGIISGYDNNLFKPQNKITREQAMAMVGRAMNITGLMAEEEIASVDMEKALASYSDAGKVSNYAKSGAAACIDSGIINGKSVNLISPKENMTRAEVAVIIKRLLEKSDLI